ncbi:hypothetical protein ONZ51_g1065 [Trametes cubensis]|uniref:Uncharacterized protein n=1 Tax=Trametes cubensis TaxID=1111947 RepID=A0AAD7U289_9APHY|nr:hypothetical protein ONZ51_g1065 [Trametes cubensis]
MRAFAARSPTLAAASRKRPRTPSPSPSTSSGNHGTGIIKHQRVESRAHGGSWQSGPTPSTTSSQRTELATDSESAIQDAKKAARLKSIEEALFSVHDTPRDPPPAPSSGFVLRENTSGPHSSSSHQSRSDVPIHPTPRSLSQNTPNRKSFSGQTQNAQTEADTSINMEELESKAVQSLLDNTGSTYEDCESASIASGAIGTSLAAAGGGTGPLCAPQSRIPEGPQGSGAERTAWSPAPPQTPGRDGPPRVFAPGGNEGAHNPSMLLTPPSTRSQTQFGSGAGAGPSTTQRGRSFFRAAQASPTPSKGSALEHSASADRSQHWQMVQDDPENPFQGHAVAQRATSPTPTVMSVADSVGGGTAGALTSDSIAAQIAALQGIPEYIAKLERREKAVRKSAEVKGRKIAQLEEEVERCVRVVRYRDALLLLTAGHVNLTRLRKEKRALEETVAALQMRR